LKHSRVHRLGLIAVAVIVGIYAAGDPIAPSVVVTVRAAIGSSGVITAVVVGVIAAVTIAIIAAAAIISTAIAIAIISTPIAPAIISTAVAAAGVSSLDA